ncbi:ferrous iron transport protein A [Nodosilinea sp. LEGE 07088]|uniref:FeoA family protein n=1 Tax=Nodosilinea sp. LEGE 07088 TaxID=2777968 RepID=UPI001882A370|nr:FeoA family protein [Nodosilinea sp. LEGE 07088]MBE9138682.1 ferrous iron transport protein A [Nodosilinea sp. LEGE 07088]
MFTGFTVSGSSLPLMKVGERGIIARLASTDASAVRDLKALGLDRGKSIHLIERFPNFVVSTGGKQIALSKRLRQSIYVRTKPTSRYH